MVFEALLMGVWRISRGLCRRELKDLNVSSWHRKRARLVTGVEKAIYQTLQNIGTLFENDGVPDQWNAQKLDDFLNIIYRQIEDSKCVMNKSEGTQDFTSRDDALKAYFDIISTVVKEKYGFSYCAWEIMRKEILHTLKFILTQNSDIML
ncbi:interferon omega-1-like [Xyrauchen texanus]|uniref:interferon omega-1-like n=1 Tax=Xyrauchen texanus TaxID=154827 RepID=UPI0022424E37|nr:interferon omega-1-like [Xyrauchen texanus]